MGRFVAEKISAVLIFLPVKIKIQQAGITFFHLERKAQRQLEIMAEAAEINNAAGVDNPPVMQAKETEFVKNPLPVPQPAAELYNLELVLFLPINIGV